jgi:Terminase small subunit
MKKIINGRMQGYPVATAIDPGSLPLRNRKQELYAQERALFNSATASARNAGYKGHVEVVASELERKPKVQARITYLTRDHEAGIAEKRKRLEEFLWDAIEIDRAAYYETVEVVITDRKGIPIRDRNGLPETKIVTQLKALEMLKPQERRLIESISYTESGKPNLKLVSKEFAHRELRRMLGGDAEVAQRTSDFTEYSDAELIAEIARLANELQVNMTVTIEPKDE